MFDKEYFHLKGLIEAYQAAIVEVAREDNLRSQKLIELIFERRKLEVPEGAFISYNRVIRTSASMLHRMLEVTNTPRKLRGFGEHLIKQCLAYYIDDEDLIANKLVSEFGMGVLLDDVYIVSVIYSWLQRDLEDKRLMDSLTSPSDKILRAILGEALSNELDQKAQAIYDSALEKVS